MKVFQVAALLMIASIAVAGCGGGSTVIPPVVTIDSVSPGIGPLVGGTEIMIKGTNFGPDSTVTLADQAVTDLVVVDSETITCRTPPAEGGTRAGVLIQNEAGLAYELNVFFYIPPPQVFGLSPDTGSPAGLIPVSISGKGFTEYDAGVNTVTIGGLPATNVVTVSDTTITCIIPTGLGPAVVEVTNNNGTGTKPAGFRYFPPPTIFSIAPNAGTPLGGTAVTILGTGFEANSPGANTVTFDNVAATSITTVDDQTITCVTPPGSDLATVKVSNGNGSATQVDGYTYYPPPTLTAVTPATGSEAGGEAMTLTGTGFLDNFAGPATVLVDGNPATSIVVVSDTQITCVTPSVSVGLVAVSIENANGTASLADAFDAKLNALLVALGSKLARVNTTTGATTDIGEMSITPTAMAFHPNGTLYAVTSSALYTVNLSSGAATKVADLSGGATITDMTFHGSTPALYGVYGLTGQTYEINITTAVVTTKGNFPSSYGRYKGGLESDGSNVYLMTSRSYPDPYVYRLTDISSSSGYSTVAINRDVHAVKGLAYFNGVMYGVNNAQSSYGTLTLYKFSSDMTSATSIGGFSSTVIAGTP